MEIEIIDNTSNVLVFQTSSDTPFILWSETHKITVPHSSTTIRRALTTKHFILHQVLRLVHVTKLNVRHIVEFIQKAIILGAPHRDIFVFVGKENEIREFLNNQNLKYIRCKIGVISDSTSSNNAETLNREDFKTIGDTGMISIVSKSKLLGFKNDVKTLLNAVEFKMFAAHFQPYMVLRPDGTIAGGTLHKLGVDLGRVFNFSMITHVNATGAGIFRNGKWTGMTGAVLYRQYDMGNIISVNMDRYGVIDTTYFQHDWVQFVTGIPKRKISNGTLLYPFSTGVWLLLILSFASFSMCLTLVYHFGKQKNSTNHTIMIPYQISLDQGLDIQIPNRAKFLTAGWMLAMVVLTNCYRTDLIKYFSFPEYETIPEDFRELDTMKDYDVLFNYIGGTSFQYFNGATNGYVKRIRERFVRELDTPTCVVKSAIVSKTACISWANLLGPVISKNLSLPGTSISLAVISDTLISFTQGWGFAKNCIYTDSFTRIFGYVRCSGLMDQYKQEAYYNVSQTGKVWLKSNDTIYGLLRPQAGSQETQLLKLQNVLAIFGVAFIGCMVGTAAMIMEIVTDRFLLHVCNTIDSVILQGKNNYY
ncbi:unnamed protein product [Allacma fusca]|uniref:Uncharacterized protein n=1 Tax=Allacma fusca TaxID=39272 RepID=A0A8J2J0R7_9HEXA|nr:unnamed protein product [Allacma fusca]